MAKTIEINSKVLKDILGNKKFSISGNMENMDLKVYEDVKESFYEESRNHTGQAIVEKFKVTTTSKVLHGQVFKSNIAKRIQTTFGYVNINEGDEMLFIGDLSDSNLKMFYLINARYEIMAFRPENVTYVKTIKRNYKRSKEELVGYGSLSLPGFTDLLTQNRKRMINHDIELSQEYFTTKEIRDINSINMDSITNYPYEYVKELAIKFRKFSKEKDIQVCNQVTSIRNKKYDYSK